MAEQAQEVPMAITIEQTALLRLMQLVSPALPVGAFAWSQGLEYAVEAGWVTDRQSCGSWIDGILDGSFGRTDLPAFFTTHRALLDGDDEVPARQARQLTAYRETAEARLEDEQLGRAMARVLAGLGVPDVTPATREPQAVLLARACVHWQISAEAGALGYAMAWAEQQVTAAIKLVPLGQSEGQELLLALGPQITRVVQEAAELPEDEFGSLCFGQAMAGCWHETQYTRLFRS